MQVSNSYCKISTCAACRLVARALEIDQLRAEKSAAEQRLVEQQRKAAEDESRNADALAKVKDSFQLAENAIVDRDQVFEPLSSVLRGE